MGYIVVSVPGFVLGGVFFFEKSSIRIHFSPCLRIDSIVIVYMEI